MFMAVSERIKALREEKGLTQAELGIFLGKSDSTVRMWELGKSEPSITDICKMVELFNTTSDYMLRGIKMMYYPLVPTKDEIEKREKEKRNIYIKKGKRLRWARQDIPLTFIANVFDAGQLYEEMETGYGLHTKKTVEYTAGTESKTYNALVAIHEARKAIKEDKYLNRKER